MTAHVLVLSDRLDLSPDLSDAVRARAERGGCSFRVIVTNPARAEFHVLHAERHKAVEEAQPHLDEMVHELRLLTGRDVDGVVSIRHDPFEAVEEELLQRPADELIVAVHDSALARRFHHDLPRRLARFDLPLSLVPSGATLTH